MKAQKVLLFIGFFLFANLVFVLSSHTAMAQGKVEICDNKADDDDDKLVDCNDPDCTEECKKDITADCSPGFYKNRLLNTDSRKRLCPITCPVATEGIIDNTECAELVVDLSAELGSDAATRAAAKAILDACYGTAAASPCTED